MRLVRGCINEVGADEVGELLLEFRRNQDADAEPLVARIDDSEVRLGLKLAAPCGEHAEIVGQIFHSDLGAELVELQLVGEALGQRFRAVDQEAAAVARGRLRDQEIHDDLALRRQQRPEPAQSRLQLADIGGDEAVEEVARILACDLDHAPIGEKRCFHYENLLRHVAGERKPPVPKRQGLRPRA